MWKEHIGSNHIITYPNANYQSSCSTCSSGPGFKTMDQCLQVGTNEPQNVSHLRQNCWERVGGEFSLSKERINIPVLSCQNILRICPINLVSTCIHMLVSMSH